MARLHTFADSPSEGTVTVTTVHENIDLRDFATLRAQQLDELMTLAGDCGDTCHAVVTALAEEIGREVSALLRAIAQGEVQHV